MNSYTLDEQLELRSLLEEAADLLNKYTALDYTLELPDDVSDWLDRVRGLVT